jgi:hypothetical protein
VVYKLFDLRIDGSLGKRLLLERGEDGEFELNDGPADLQHTLEKLAILNEAGAHPTEIVGLSESGDYLIVKQPLAGAALDFQKDRRAAVESIHGVFPSGARVTTTVVVIWIRHHPWLVGDLHSRNVMRDLDGHPTIIDALLGPVPVRALDELAWLRYAAEDAQALRLGRPLRRRSQFDDVDDALL